MCKNNKIIQNNSIIIIYYIKNIKYTIIITAFYVVSILAIIKLYLAKLYLAKLYLEK